jgi:hypothetical protein
MEKSQVKSFYTLSPPLFPALVPYYALIRSIKMGMAARYTIHTATSRKMTSPLTIKK